MVTYERALEIVFDSETKRLFTKWSLTGGGHLREEVAIAMRELTVYATLFAFREEHLVVSLLILSYNQTLPRDVRRLEI